MRGYTYFIGVGLGDAAVPDHFLALAHELVNRGHTVVLLSWGKGTYKAQTDCPNLHVYHWPSPRPTHSKDAFFLYRLIKQYEPACLIGNFGAVNVMTVIGWLTRVPCRAAWYHGLSGQISLDWHRGQWHKQVLRLRKRAVYHLIHRKLNFLEFLVV